VTADEIVADEDIDPRFAGLLKPRNEKPVAQTQSPIKDVAQLHGSQKQEFHQAEELATALEEGLGQKPTVESTQLSGVAAKQVLDQLVQPAHHNLQSQGQVHPQGFDAVKGMPQTPTVQLSNGYQIPESQIFDQVVTQISGSVNGESGRMVLRLQPAELGSLKLDLKIEGDRVQAHLHAQTHQVQEVLERNLPQLRSALAEQGLKIDQFLVNVDQRQAEGQFDGQAQYQHQGSERRSDWNQQDHVNEEQMIPLAHLMQNGGGGISLHV
jgi:flagellar hook-length control protein FliK